MNRREALKALGALGGVGYGIRPRGRIPYPTPVSAPSAWSASRRLIMRESYSSGSATATAPLRLFGGDLRGTGRHA